MRHLKDYRQLNRSSEHRRAMFRNMATSLFLHERIQTTEAKAKELRRYAEKLITLGKRYAAFGDGAGDTGVAAKKLHVHRQALSYLRDKKAIERVLGELATRYETRPGGYTRIIKLGPRRGDAAEMVFIELVKTEEAAQPKEKRRRRRKAKGEGDAAETAAETKAAKKASAKAERKVAAPAKAKSEPEPAPEADAASDAPEAAAADATDESKPE
ncbi:MAG: 50S ribosomal protein L17 [Deltaproteobacteria bacterium]|nr:50S ribosomal protein L17 [Deltaproteobacteria bacterium]